MKLDEIVRHAQEVGRKTTYPITSADQLVDALGGDQAKVRIGSKDHQGAEVRQIPAAYFPIESEADFIAKITHVLVLSGEPVEDQLTQGKASGTPPAAVGSPPNLSNLPNLPQPRGVPSASGWK
jgi:hypothetical protein